VTLNEKGQLKKGETIFQRQKERKSIGNHERGDRTAENME
jgi:hypothetical protein